MFHWTILLSFGTGIFLGAVIQDSIDRRRLLRVEKLFRKEMDAYLGVARDAVEEMSETLDLLERVIDKERLFPQDITANRARAAKIREAFGRLESGWRLKL